MFRSTVLLSLGSVSSRRSPRRLQSLTALITRKKHEPSATVTLFEGLPTTQATVTWKLASPFLCERRPRRQADHSPLACADFKNAQRLLPLPRSLHCVMLIQCGYLVIFVHTSYGIFNVRVYAFFQSEFSTSFLFAQSPVSPFTLLYFSTSNEKLRHANIKLIYCVLHLW